MTKSQVTEEINRVISCADFRHERILRHDCEEYVANLELARALISRPSFHAPGVGPISRSNQDHDVATSLNHALDALVRMRADLECFDEALRRPIGANLDDAEDTIRTLADMFSAGFEVRE